MPLIEALTVIFQFALVVILSVIVAVKWTAILITFLWNRWARKKAQ